MTRQINCCPFRFLVVFVISLATFVLQIVGNENIVTCEGRCGQYVKAPCSCQSICVVYNNCCENMTTYCPQVVVDGHLSFGHLFQSDVTCHESQIFVISSCPRRAAQNHSEDSVTLNPVFGAPVSTKTPAVADRENNHEGESSQPLPQETGELLTSLTPNNLTAQGGAASSDVGVESSTVSSDWQLPMSVEDLMINKAVMTDDSTNLSYLNSEIFLCNKGQMSNRIIWNASSTLDFDSFDRSESEIAYRPPTSLTQLSTCTHQSVVTCWRWGHDSTLQQLCQSFTSYVQGGDITYKNRFCVLCSKNPETRYSTYIPPILRVYGIGLSVLFSLVSDNLIQITPMEAAIHRPSWQTATCSAGNTTQSIPQSQQGLQNSRQVNEGKVQFQLRNLQCQITKCIPGLELRADGLCKARHNVFVSFPVEMLPLTKAEMQKLPAYVDCSFQKYIGIEMINMVPSVTLRFDVTTKKEMYFVHIQAYISDNGGELIGYSVTADLIVKHFVIIKALKLHLEQKREVAPPVFQKGSQTSGTQIDPTQSETLKGPHFKGLFRNRENLLMNSTSVQICHFKSLIQESAKPIMLCVVDDMFEEDLTKIYHFSKLNCLSVFTSGNSRCGVSFALLQVFIWALATTERFGFS